ncbi:MAM and LDL-receptor class A domain-containing protein 1 isoform X1 [Chanodichthys erythropterus]|uniref:MAM and LDL-receptor class A domain-containing protein 1 isoform X1 n=1 Tax=Chanodichthys erythropterus TaxID=933992 RepID=UPI00351E9A6C
MRGLFLLLLVSMGLASCPDGQFQCIHSQECLSMELVCDFHPNCTDGSDEEFCGPCNFDEHACGWIDSSNDFDEFKWRREMANISDVPGVDHTTGSPWGGVMHAEDDYASIFSKAILEHTLPRATAVGCKLSFWYHLHDPVNIASDFSLSLIGGTSPVKLWSIKKGQTNGWENACLLIGNRPLGLKLVFSVDPISIGDQDIMLDDITMTDCAEGDIPAASDHLSCDFENDTCSWYHDQSTEITWKREDGQNPPFGYEGPAHDHTTGSGYFMFIAPQWSSKPPQTARLIGFPQQAKCVSFWYIIYGGKIGSLRFITKHANGNQTLMWMRTGTQGNKWRFVDLSFTDSEEPVQMIFEGILEGTKGYIAIDDVQVSNGSCPAERECTFQASLCGLLSDPTADFTWIRTNGELATGTPSPATDHTLETDKGFYLSAQLWKNPSGSRGSMLMKVNQPSSEHGECLMFWYHMSGRDVGSLNIYVQELHSAKSQILVWSVSGDQGEQWRDGRATVISPHSPYKVIFEAVVGNEQNHDIAIDDLTIINDPCPPHGFCDFEMDMCGWVNTHVNSSSVDWSWTSGTSAGSFGPEVDHTTNTAMGHYMAFDMSSSTDQIAHLESEMMETESQGCLDFWLHMHMWSVEKLTLAIYVNESGSLRCLWNQTGNHENVWHHITVDYQSSERHKIVFEAVRPYQPFDSAVIALDDIYIRRNTRCSDLIPTTPAPTTEPTSPPASSMDCNFQEGLCDWIQETDDGFDWIHQVGGKVNEPWLGPLYDHTLKNDNGFYLIINMSGEHETSETAVISAPMIIQSSDVCIGFWYYMLGPSLGNLDLLIETKTMETITWTRRGSQTSEWLNAQVSINTADVDRVKFLGSRTAGGSGFIAIDDFRVTAGACVEQNPCGFESPLLCGFEPDVTDSNIWLREGGSSGHTDHTYRTELGHSMAVLGSNLQKPEVSNLLTPEYSPSTESCVQFWYRLSAGSGDSLSVHVLLNGELGPALWSLSGMTSDSWEVAEVTVSSPSKFRVAFRAELSPNSESFVLLDDVSVKTGACSPAGSCDFESGKCTWVNVANGVTDEHDWILADGHYRGPPIDYTTHTADGKFLLSQSQRNRQGQKSSSVLTSERIRPTGDSCFEFWYHINGSDPGILRVLLDSEATEQELLFETRVTGNNWENVSITVSETKPFQIHIEAQTGSEGYIAVDDIRLTNEPCKDISVESGVFVGCDFETDTCEWKDISVGQFVWERDQNGTTTANTGPSVDHTTGTELGWYMAVEASHGDQNSYAALQSPAMKEASNECLLEFYYHMFGEGIGELKVFLQEGPRRTPLWWMTGNHGDEWHRAELNVARTHQVFTLLFEATRTFSELGDIAIDDITFFNCTLPEPHESCQEGMFTCSNHVCVEPNRVCDYSDDCGDGSDEELCDVKGYKHRCSFEQGMCSWEKSDLEAGWILQKGEQAWLKHGPPRDHTRNTAAGHYITPAHELTEIISRTLLPSSDCTVRFYHYSHGDSTSSRLVVALRMLRNGDDDQILWDKTVKQSFLWHRAEVTFSTLVKSKIVFQYVGNGETQASQTAVDDISFSMTCVHDPDNSELPVTPEPTMTPATATTTKTDAPSASPTVNPCKENEFHCWRSDGVTCIAAGAQCNYVLDCPLGEDEETCGPCNFENGQCQWSDISVGPNKWQRVKATDNTDLPTDHTTGTGHYMQTFIMDPSKNEAVFQSPSLPISSAYCQLLFHFHVGAGSSGNLSVILQKGEDRKLLWTRSNSISTEWVPEHLPLGKQDQSYRIIFSSQTSSQTTALDDVSFHNCEKDYQPPDFSLATCSFEKDLCGWIQGAAEDLDWERWSGPTETPNTGPSGDHTSGKGYYLYINSSSHGRTGAMAHLKSPLSPPTEPDGYCFTFWYHMFGATVGSLRMSIYDISSNHITLMWQRKGSQRNEWQLAQSHVKLTEVHQILIEASVGGLSGHIAIDDLAVTKGACAPTEGFCDFEEGDCGWIQQADDDLDWIRVSGNNVKSKSRPGFDHTTNTASGSYFYMESAPTHVQGHRAIMTSPLLQTGDAKCLQLWYYMEGQGTGTLNVYQQFSDKDQPLLETKSGEQGGLWRFAQTPLTLSGSNYKIVVEGIAGQTEQGVIALDDVQVSNYPCTPSGQCDFEANFCSWMNLMEVDDADWLRAQAGTGNHTRPSVDHTTNTSTGYYLYMDSSVGFWGETAMILSEIFTPDSRGHCFTFWYHMYGHNVGTLKLYINNGTIHNSGNKFGQIVWVESGDQGDVWRRGNIYVSYQEPFWFIFEFLKGAGPKGSIAIDDIHIIPGPCDSDSTSPSPHSLDTVGIGVGVGVTLLVIFTVGAVLFVLNKKRKRESIIEDDVLDRNFSYSPFDCNMSGLTFTAENGNSSDLREISLSADENDASFT